jgi:hypothetical protein
METNMRFKLYHDHPGAKAGDMNGLIETMRADLVRLQEMAKAGVTCEAYGIGPPTLFTTDKAVADRYGMTEEQPRPILPLAPFVPSTAASQQERANRVREQVAEYIRREIRDEE